MTLVVSTHDQNPDDLPGIPGVPGSPETLINFAKRLQLAELCTEGLQFQSKPYSDVVDNPDILQFLEDQLFLANGITDEWFWNKALEVQKGEEDHSDIRYGTMECFMSCAIIHRVFIRFSFFVYRRGLEAAGF